MTESNEPSYYEVALTNRQVLIAFVVILGSVLAAFLSGVWVGRKNAELPSAEMRLAAATEAEDPLAQLDELAFFGGANDSDTADDSVSNGGAVSDNRKTNRQEPPGQKPPGQKPPGQKPASKPDLSELLVKPKPETTLAQDVGSEPAKTAAPPPPARTEEKSAGEDAAKEGAEGFIIQVFSTRDEPQAKKVLGQLREGGFRAFLSPVDVAGQTMYRVRVGPFRERAGAERRAREVKERLKLDTWITAASN